MPYRSPASVPAHIRRRRTVAALILVMLVIAIYALVTATHAGASSATPDPDASGSAAASSAATAAPTTTATPTAAATPTTTPRATATPAATPTALPANGLRITSFDTAEGVAVCPTSRKGTVPLTFRWVTAGATQAWFAEGTTNAQVDPNADADPVSEVDTTTNNYSSAVYDCSDDQEIFALTVTDGTSSVSATTIVVRQVDH